MAFTPLRTVLTRATCTSARTARPSLPRDRAAAIAPFHRTAAARLPYKDDMDRESLKPKAHENTQSGTDDQVAQDSDAAFNPNKTDPDSERAAAARENTSQPGEGSPLDESAGNPDFAGNTTGSREDHRPGGSGDSRKPSGGGDAPKKTKVKSK